MLVEIPAFNRRVNHFDLSIQGEPLNPQPCMLPTRNLNVSLKPVSYCVLSLDAIHECDRQTDGQNCASNSGIISHAQIINKDDVFVFFLFNIVHFNMR